MKNWQQWYRAVTPEVWEQAARTKALVCDVDGVFSDGRIYLGNDGEELKAFHTRDGFGIKALLHAGIDVAVITGRRSRIVAQRMQSLGIEHIYQGQDSKLIAFKEIQEKLAIDADEIAYIGDDMIDLPVLDQCGLSCSVPDGHPLVTSQVDYVTATAGGYGAVREVADLLLHARGLLYAAQGTSV